MGALKNSAPPRRVSPRLQKVPEDKRPFYGSPDRKRTSSDTSSSQNDDVKKKKPKVEKSSASPAQNDHPKEKLSQVKTTSGSEDVEEVGVDWFLPGGPLTDEDLVRHATLLKEIRRVYNLRYLHFVQEEEKRCSKNQKEKGFADGSGERSDDKVSPKRSAKSPTKSPAKSPAKSPTKKTDPEEISENGEACRAKPKCKSKRPDLKALSKMREKKEVLYPESRIGQLPGIEVGCQFYSRAEMAAVGLHTHWLGGIDYIAKAEKDRYRGYSLPLAVAIVLSGQYEDDVDNLDEVVYTGSGVNDLLGSKKQVKDQVLQRGNLALKHNKEQRIPVRVIRGHESGNRNIRKVYTYDGLYQVVQYWKDDSGEFSVYKYSLKRLPNQPPLLTKQVHFVRAQGSKGQPKLPGLVCKDICNGQENICIPATNIIDVPPVAPEGLTYATSIKVAKDVKIPPSAPGCSCNGNCTNPLTCSCAILNGSDFPYVAKDGGRLIEAKAVVFECGPHCGCGPSCVNRTSQRGLKYRLEVYRTPNKGWAVRSWDFIPSGAPVCEYIGVLRKTDEVDSVSENDYIFEIDCWHTMNGIGSREKRMGDVSIPDSDAEKRLSKLSETEPEFCIDANTYGNVARYINHSCEPNLFVQCVLSSHHDIRLARIVLFAADNIPPMQELTYDYGYELDSVVGPDGKIKKLACCCGDIGCRKRLY